MHENNRALSVRQPHAEAIMRGIKTVEYRSRRTNVRGRIYIYASMGRYQSGIEAEMLDEYGISDVCSDDLPRGVLIGTVELYDCDDGDWKLREPKRLSEPVKPLVHPQPIWFYPFEVLKYAGKAKVVDQMNQPRPAAPTSDVKPDTPKKPARAKSRTSKYAKNWQSIFRKN
ncbi:MAG: ASCH domain-containing protein [Pirellulaceae bacterium]|jgi:hypothetical protein